MYDPEKDIEALNRSLLEMLRTLANKSIPEACAVFGVTESFAASVAAMAGDDIEKLIPYRRMLFAPIVKIDKYLEAANLPSSKDRAVMARLCAAAPAMTQ